MLQLYGWQRSRQRLLSRYARVLVASRHMADEYARHGLASRVRVVHLPIESTRPVLDVHEGASGWRLLYLGRLERAKGPDIALASAARVAQSSGQPVHLRVAGDGSMRSGLEARAAELMAANPSLRVTFMGWIDAAAATAAIDQSDLLLVPSTWPEPFGMVGVEAALRGVPAVAFAVGGIPEWLEDGVTGRLVSADPPDASRFAAAIQACLADRPTLTRMRAQSRASAARFTVAAHLQALEQVFAEATSARTAMHSPIPSALAGTLR
jgi:glycosyltransferase involved in cell wall biosynthesis